MKDKLLFLLFIAFLIGCKEEDMSLVDGGLNQAILEKHIWKNEILIDEVFTDNTTPERYSRFTTLSFTGTQYSHSIQDSIKENFLNNSNVDPTSGRLREFWGDYTINPIDSTLILSYRVNEKIQSAMNIPSDSLVISTKYKILKLSENELTVQMRNDSTSYIYNTPMTFKPVK
jgi:hypothetical protein